LTRKSSRQRANPIREIEDPVPGSGLGNLDRSEEASCARERKRFGPMTRRTVS